MFSTAGLARFSARRPWTVVFAWMLLLVIAIGVASTSLEFTNDSTFTGDPESLRAAELVKERLYGGADDPLSETVIVRSENLTVDDPAYRQVVERTANELRAMPQIVAGVYTYYDSVAASTPDDLGLVSADRHSTLLAVTLVGDIDQASEHVEEYNAAIERQQTEGFQVLTVGSLTVGEAFNRQAEEDLLKGEGLGLLAALVVLIVVFGALVVAGVPIVLAFVAIIVAIGLTAVLGQVMDLSFFIVNMITMIGLAVGIDYALFIVSRYREERRRGYAKQDAIEIAGGTASKAVFFSGATVVLALLGMFLIPTVTFRSLGAGAILVVIAAVAATLTLGPDHAARHGSPDRLRGHGVGAVGGRRAAVRRSR
jgi:RND superfamily putative drug exporter